MCAVVDVGMVLVQHIIASNEANTDTVTCTSAVIINISTIGMPMFHLINNCVGI